MFKVYICVVSLITLMTPALAGKKMSAPAPEIGTGYIGIGILILFAGAWLAARALKNRPLTAI